MSKLFYFFIITSFLIISGCTDDSLSKSVQVEDLYGTWECDKKEYRLIFIEPNLCKIVNAKFLLGQDVDSVDSEFGIYDNGPNKERFLSINAIEQIFLLKYIDGELVLEFRINNEPINSIFFKKKSHYTIKETQSKRHNQRDTQFLKRKRNSGPAHTIQMVRPLKKEDVDS